VSEGGGCGRQVQERIMRDEVKWVTKHHISKPNHAKYQKIIGILEDAETILTIRQHIQLVGHSE